MHNGVIENTDGYFYLELTVDSCLRWENRILKLCKKLSPVVCHLQRMSFHLTTEQISSFHISNFHMFNLLLTMASELSWIKFSGFKTNVLDSSPKILIMILEVKNY